MLRFVVWHIGLSSVELRCLLLLYAELCSVVEVPWRSVACGVFLALTVSAPRSCSSNRRDCASTSSTVAWYLGRVEGSGLGLRVR